MIRWGLDGKSWVCLFLMLGLAVALAASEAEAEESKTELRQSLKGNFERLKVRNDKAAANVSKELVDEIVSRLQGAPIPSRPKGKQLAVLGEGRKGPPRQSDQS